MFKKFNVIKTARSYITDIPKQHIEIEKWAHIKNVQSDEIARLRTFIDHQKQEIESLKRVIDDLKKENEILLSRNVTNKRLGK